MKKKNIIVILIVGILLGILILLIYGVISLKQEKKEKLEITDELVEKGIFSEYYEQAKEVVSKMTLQEKVGQMFLVQYNQNDVEYLSNSYPGGYVLFAKDFQKNNKQAMIEEIKKDQSLNKYPLIMAVDEEGGTVTRISRYISYRDHIFKSPREYYEEGGYELLEETETEKMELLKSLGINLNLAPVADMVTNEEDYMYERSFGKGPEETSEFVKNMVSYANKNHMNSCLKHFPGYGSNSDTHTGSSIDERSYESIRENDYKPFEAGIKEGVPCILISHNVVVSIDKDYPASLSQKMVKELREKLGFSGIIITDDLAMDAVQSYVEDGNAATLAVQAGNDMIITSDFIDMKNEIIEAVEEGTIEEATINNAVMRIIAWKYYSGLFEK
ncbi:MAG: beta-hexosaminidase [Bacilli bacterium]|nr:beta-hexosaminidase [Bacilli bacterium]